MSDSGRSKFFDIQRIQRETEVDMVVFEASVASTNSLALGRTKEWSEKQRVLVLTDQQTAGRGRGGNQWWSGSGALTMTLVVRGEFLRGADWMSGGATPATISLAVGDGVCRALEGFQVAGAVGQVGLKWPNDVWLGDRKLGGILIEVPSSGDCLIVGLGLNINNSFAAAPTDVRQIAASTFDHWRRKLPLSDVVIAVVNELQVQLEAMRGSRPRFAAGWQRRSVLDGRMVSFRFGDRSVRARCAGIGDDGALLLETSSGIERFLAGTIDHID